MNINNLLIDAFLTLFFYTWKMLAIWSGRKYTPKCVVCTYPFIAWQVDTAGHFVNNSFCTTENCELEPFTTTQRRL